MTQKQDIDTLIATTLKIPLHQVTDDLTYQAISEWNSLNHITLMLVLENAFHIHIDGELLVQLISVADIKNYLHSLSSTNEEVTPTTKEAVQERTEATMSSEMTNQGNATTQIPTVHRGLSGVSFDRTTITHIDGQHGQLLYRGYSIKDLIEHSNFEEVAYLLLYKELPDHTQLKSFSAQLQAAQTLPDAVLETIKSMQHAHPIDVARTATSMLAAFNPDREDNSYQGTLNKGIQLLAQFPMIVAAHERLRNQLPIIAPDTHLSFGANFFFMLTGERAVPDIERIIDTILILYADHSSNASTFTARIATSTGIDIHAAITAAIATFAGPLHGGAVEKVMEMLQEIGSPARADEYVRQKHDRQEPVMGFGHRVYRTDDPRALQMRRMVQELSLKYQAPEWLEITDALIIAMQPYARLGAHINVDFYAGIIYHLLHMPNDLSVPIFMAGRMIGWVAQILEQMENNILIRPLLHYVGEPQRPYVHRDSASMLEK